MTTFTALPTVSVANFISEANLLIEIFGSAVILAFEVMDKLLSPLWLSTTARLSLQTFSIPYCLLYGIQGAPGDTNDVGHVWRLHLGKKEIFHPFCLLPLSCHLLHNYCKMDVILWLITIFCCTKSFKTICLSVFDLQLLQGRSRFLLYDLLACSIWLLV